MSLFHCSIDVIGRKPSEKSPNGRSSTGAAAYRAGERIVDERTGRIHDYTRKQGVLQTGMFGPQGLRVDDRGAFWNRVEMHHKRGDAILARDATLAGQAELTAAENWACMTRISREAADRFGVVVDTCMHAPDKGGDNRNLHGHVTFSACSVSPTGELGLKCNELDPIHCQRAKIANAADWMRGRWAEICNEALADAGSDARIDHRSNAERGIETAPGEHLGPHAIGFERRTGEKSEKRANMERRQREVADRLAAAAMVGQLERQIEDLDASIIDLTSNIDAALVERERRRSAQIDAQRLRQPISRPGGLFDFSQDLREVADEIRQLPIVIPAERPSAALAARAARLAAGPPEPLPPHVQQAVDRNAVATGNAPVPPVPVPADVVQAPVEQDSDDDGDDGEEGMKL